MIGRITSKRKYIYRANQKAIDFRRVLRRQRSVIRFVPFPKSERANFRVKGWYNRPFFARTRVFRYCLRSTFMERFGASSHAKVGSFRFLKTIGRPRENTWAFSRYYMGHGSSVSPNQLRRFYYYGDKPSFGIWSTFQRRSISKVFLYRPYYKRHPFRIDIPLLRVRRWTTFLKNKYRLIRMRLFYGIFSHRKFVRLIKHRCLGDQSQTRLFSLMERRLDVMLYRSGFCRSIYSAQQLVRHGGILVSGKVKRNFYYPIRFFEKVTFSTKALAYQMQYVFLLQLWSKRLRSRPVRYLVVDFLYMYFYVRPCLFPIKDIPLSGGVLHRFLTNK